MDDVIAAASVPWFMIWEFAAGFAIFFWIFMIYDLRVDNTFRANCLLLLVYMILSSVEFLSFVKVLRTAEMVDLGFMLTIFWPCIAFWANAGAGFVWMRDVYTKSFLRGRFSPVTTFSLINKWHLCVPIAEGAFALAHCSHIGLVMFVVRFVAVSFACVIFRLHRGLPPQRRRPKKALPSVS